MDQKISEDDLPASDVQMVFGLGPPLPLAKISDPDQEELIEALKKALQRRIEARADLTKFVLEKRK